MPTFTLNHEIRCNTERFWQLFFDREFNDKLYKEALEFPEYSILEQRDTDTEIIRKVAGQPKMNMPGPVAKVLGSGFKYVEEGSFDKAKRIWRWKMTPSTLAEKMRNEGSVRVEALGDDRVRRVAEIVVEAKIFGIGGMIESSAEKQLREGWEKSAVFMNKWIETHK
jgi:hypothetical protein